MTPGTAARPCCPHIHVRCPRACLAARSIRFAAHDALRSVLLGHDLTSGTRRDFCGPKRGIRAGRAKGESIFRPVHDVHDGTLAGNGPLKLRRTTNRQVSLEKRTAATEAWRVRCLLLLLARELGSMVAGAPCGRHAYTSDAIPRTVLGSRRQGYPFVWLHTHPVLWPRAVASTRRLRACGEGETPTVVAP